MLESQRSFRFCILIVISTPPPSAKVGVIIFQTCVEESLLNGKQLQIQS